MGRLGVCRGMLAYLSCVDAHRPCSLAMLACHLHSHVGRRGVLGLVAPYTLYKSAVLVGRPQLPVRNSRPVVAAVRAPGPLAGGHHSAIV